MNSKNFFCLSFYVEVIKLTISFELTNDTISYFELQNETTSWFDAKINCEKTGKQLATIKSEEDKQNLLLLFGNNSHLSKFCNIVNKFLSMLENQFGIENLRILRFIRFLFI